MAAPEASHADAFSWLLGILSFICAGGALGWLRYRLEARQAPQTAALVEAQIEQAHADASHTVIESLSLGFQEIRADIERIRSDRDAWQARALAAEKQIEQIHAEQTLKRLKGGNGKSK